MATPLQATAAAVAVDTRFVIERTLEYRRGYGGAPAWPSDVIYVGDEDDQGNREQK